MRQHERTKPRDAGRSGIPELDDDRSEFVEAVDEAVEGIAHTFTVERDTSLADGAGAPGSTAVGGLNPDDAEADDHSRRRR